MSETTIDAAAEAVAELETTPEVQAAEAVADEVSELDVQLLRRLADQARGQGLELTGEDGLLQQLTKRR